MRRTFAALVAAALLAIPAARPAQATAVALDTWYTFSFDGPATPFASGASVTLGTNPDALAAPDPAWTFLLSAPGELFVLDLFQSTDQFEIFDMGASQGVTSAPTSGAGCDSDITCAINDTRYSRGTFSLAAGAHSITGTQLLGSGGGGAFIVRELTSEVPLPGALGLQGAVVALGLGVAWRRRRRNAA